jgi:hypothetical protein
MVVRFVDIGGIVDQHCSFHNSYVVRILLGNSKGLQLAMFD